MALQFCVSEHFDFQSISLTGHIPYSHFSRGVSKWKLFRMASRKARLGAVFTVVDANSQSLHSQSTHPKRIQPAEPILTYSQFQIAPIANKLTSLTHRVLFAVVWRHEVLAAFNRSISPFGGNQRQHLFDLVLDVGHTLGWAMLYSR